MSILVYSISGAPRPWRVLLGLAFKGLPHEIRLLEASSREHKSEPFLSLNPRGTVPVLVDGETVIRDSIGALAWLDRAYPDHPLFGENPDDAARIWQRTTEFCDYLRDTCNGVLTPIFFQGARTVTPDLQEAADALRSEFSLIENMLADADFLSGAKPGAADAAAFPEVRLVQRAVETHPGVTSALGLAALSQDYPRLVTWKSRIETLANVAETFPPHWKEAA